jgi:selenocysteine lyase/cysteine desulfurase
VKSDPSSTGPAINWAEVRKYFPAVERCTYLNTAAGGPMCRHAVDETTRYLEEIHAHGDAKWDEWVDRAEGVRRNLARALKAAPEEIAFLSNSSAGMNLIAEMFGREGEVLTMAGDFPSVTLPWLLRGYPVRFLPCRADGSVTLEEIDEAIGRKTKYLVVSHVQFATGFRQDLEGLGGVARSRGLRLVLDATQGFGAFPVDVERSSADALVFSGYKWLTAGYGIAPLYVKRELLQSLTPPAAGWRSAKAPYELKSDRLDLTDEARGLELGHMPFAGIFALGGALRLVDEIGVDHIEARIQDLTEYLHQSMDREGIPLQSPRERKYRSGITVLGVPDPPTVAEKLMEKNIFVAARRNGLRVALHFYNNHEDIERFTIAMRHVLGKG